MPLPAAPFTGEYANLLELFDAVVAQCGDVEAFVDGNSPAADRLRITFAEWERAADGVATRLASMGVAQGDIVGISLPSSIEYAVAYQGVVRLGAVASGMNPKLGPAEIEHIIAKSSPKVIITDALVVNDPAVTVLSVEELRDAYNDEPFAARPNIVDTDLLAIVWTSGTTGKPKGAMFDHACLRAMTRAAGPLSAVGDRRLSPLPFAHVGYMTRVWDELMHVITTIICPTPWTAVGALKLVEEERVTVGQGVPAQWQMMLAHPDLATTDTSSLRIVSSGAARIPPEMVDAMRDRFNSPVVVRYTSTEACVSTGTSLDDPDDAICNTVGTPGSGVEMELRLDEGRGRGVERTDTGDTEVGTVCLRSRAMMRGYWQEPELTADAIDENGWLLTGDLGFLDARGDLHLAGRSTEMYIRGGYNVYPIEVENHLGQHDLVDRVAVTGTAAPVLGEIGVAFVVPADASHPPTLEQLRAWCNERLASYKAPDALVLLDELPLTAMSKIDKRALAPAAAEAEKAWER